MNEPSPAWRVHGERSIYENRWMTLSRVDVEPPGVERFEHHVVRLNSAAIAAVVDGQDRVLMLRQYRFVPGGRVSCCEQAGSRVVGFLSDEVGLSKVAVNAGIRPEEGRGHRFEHRIELSGGFVVAEEGQRVASPSIEVAPVQEDADHLRVSGVAVRRQFGEGTVQCSSAVLREAGQRAQLAFHPIQPGREPARYAAGVRSPSFPRQRDGQIKPSRIDENVGRLSHDVCQVCDRVALLLYLVGLMTEAIEDLHDMDLYDRFISWAR